MTRVYRIGNDISRYQYFLPAVKDEALALWMHDCQSRADTWTPPEVFIYEPLLRSGDFLNFSRSELILTPYAADRLAWHLLLAGELLPLPYKEATYYLLNVMQCINCLNEESSRFAYVNGRRLHIQRYVFYDDRFPESTIFKIPETHSSEILVSERTAGEGFIADIKRLGIRGYRLELLWDSESDS